MAAVKRAKSAGGRYAEPDNSSPEDERALAQLLALLNGRSDIDWGSLTPEDRRVDRQR